MATSEDRDRDALFGLSAEEISRQAKNFLEGPLGTYILACIKQDIEIARDKLEELDPWQDRWQEEWESAQFRLDAARKVEQYLSELLLVEEVIDDSYD